MIYLIIYITGVFTSYFLNRALGRKLYKEWTIGDRAIVAIFSVFSWIAALAGLMVSGVVYLYDGDSNHPVKW